MRLYTIVLAALLGLSMNCAFADSHSAAGGKAADPKTAKAQQMIEDADKARKKAASLDGEWRDTGKIIKKAKAALKKGDTVTAMKLAAKAHKQGALGYQQAQTQQTLRMPSYLKY